MYAHEVVGDLELLANFYSNTKVPSGVKKERVSMYMKALSLFVLKAQKFHMKVDKGSAICKLNVELLRGENGGVRLPYPITWLDLFRELDPPGHKPGKYERTDGEYPVRKRGLIAVELNPQLLFVQVFNCFDKNISYSHILTSAHKGWQPSPIFELVCLDSKLSDHSAWISEKVATGELPFNVPDSNAFAGRDENVAGYSMLPGMENEDFSGFVKEDQDELSQFNTFLKLISCKNIATATHEPDAKLNKSRVKKGKQPVFTYKTLVIKPTSKRQQAIEAQGLWENRIHLCRGHFKEYSEEKPLFGKYTGRYWWQPSVRGRNKNGVVVKDYEVKV